MAPTFVLMFMAQGGLKYRAFLLWHLDFFFIVWFGLFSNLYSYPAFFRASWYLGATLSNISLLEDSPLNLLFMAIGMFFVMLGGWLLNL